MAMEDLYATYCALGGGEPGDARAAAAGLPPVDGVDVWPLVSGANATSPRRSVPVGSDGGEANLANGTRVQAIVRGDGYKLMIGATGQNIWTGKYYPNASTSWNDVPYHCGVPANGSTPAIGKGGCLFNILDDPTEHHELDVTTPANAKIVAELFAELSAVDATTFTPNRGKVAPEACQAAVQTSRGFWGPFTS
jgi:arylsulfatase I/J